MDKDKEYVNGNDFDYTIVMDASYVGPELNGQDGGAGDRGASDADYRALVDREYSEYEQMCLRLPSVFDSDDIYPHSYQWRMGDKYDPAKVNAVREALEKRVKIADTEAYQIYTEEIKNRSFRPDAWD